MKTRLILLTILSACITIWLHAVENYNHLIDEARRSKNAGDYERALKYFDKAAGIAKSYHAKYSAWIQAADMMMGRKDYAGAERRLKKILANVHIKENQRATVLSRLGRIRQSQGNENAAENYFQRALRQNPTGETRQGILNSLATLKFNQKKYDIALDLFRKADSVSVNPHKNHGNQGHTKLYLARIAVIQKRYNDALRYYSDVPNILYVNSWIALAAFQEKIQKILLPQKRYREAQDCLNNAEARPVLPYHMKRWIPEYRAMVSVAEAETLVSRKQFDEASNLLNEAKQTFPDYRKGKLKDQVSYVESLIHLEQGRDLKWKRRYEDAKKEFRKVLAIKNRKNDHLANIEMGYLFLEQRQFSSAKKYFTDAERIPGLDCNQKLRNMIAFGDYFKNVKQYDNALQYLKRELPEDQISPAQKALLYSKTATVYFLKKDMEQTAEFCRKALEIPEIPKPVKREAEALLKKAEKTN